MKLLDLLLVVSTATLVVCQDWTTVKVPLDLLLPDLQAIEKYFSEVSHGVVAFVRWPHEITFTIRNKASILEVSGHFYDEIGSIWDIFYFKDDTFYSRDGVQLVSYLELYVEGQREDSIRMASEPGIKGYLSISYNSLDEIKKMIRPFFDTNTDYSLFSFDELPKTFLATKWGCYPYLVEYTMWTQHPYLKEADGGLRVLIGEAEEDSQKDEEEDEEEDAEEDEEEDEEEDAGEDAKVLTLRSVEASQLVFHQDTNTLNVPQTGNRYVFVQNIFAVRMANTGFLADVSTSGFRMLSSNDLEYSPIPNQHVIPIVDLMKKVQSVEPRFSYEKQDVTPKSWPDNVQFQVQGHLLVKKMNFRGDNLDEDCPITVHNIAMPGGEFQYGNDHFHTICTDDSKLWLKGIYREKIFLRTDESIILYHSTQRSGL